MNSESLISFDNSLFDSSLKIFPGAEAEYILPDENAMPPADWEFVRWCVCSVYDVLHGQLKNPYQPGFGRCIVIRKK